MSRAVQGTIGGILALFLTVVFTTSTWYLYQFFHSLETIPEFQNVDSVNPLKQLTLILFITQITSLAFLFILSFYMAGQYKR